ncbi:MAG: GAF and ANTAR domain-containing protein [Sporichthyaceae bacterium]
MTNGKDEAPLWGTLTEQFEQLAASLSAAASTGPLAPEHVVQFAARAVPSAEHCGLTLLRPGKRPETVAATGPVPRRVDELQYSTGEGPCLQASADTPESGEVVRSPDLSREHRWPAFTRLCLERTPVRGMLGVKLILAGNDRGALNFYAESVGTFSELDAAMGAIFAPFAALALQNTLHARDVANLETALQSSRQIGTAMGILMARQLITADQAFAQLSAASQQLNRKLRDIAADVERTGQLPHLPGSRPVPVEDPADPNTSEAS